MRDDNLTSPSGIVDLYPTKGTHWAMSSDQFYLNSYGCPPPVNIVKQIKDGLY